jgi:hypothetical protein
MKSSAAESYTDRLVTNQVASATLYRCHSICHEKQHEWKQAHISHSTNKEVMMTWSYAGEELELVPAEESSCAAIVRQ